MILSPRWTHGIAFLLGVLATSALVALFFGRQPEPVELRVTVDPLPVAFGASILMPTSTEAELRLAHGDGFLCWYTTTGGAVWCMAQWEGIVPPGVLEWAEESGQMPSGPTDGGR